MRRLRVKIISDAKRKIEIYESHIAKIRRVRNKEIGILKSSCINACELACPFVNIEYIARNRGMH